MTRSNLRFVVAPARKPRVRARHADWKTARAWSARACELRAAAAAQHRFNRITAQRFGNVAR
eukprot:7346704-Lingulodinium_polyedra.AAC.1